MLRCGPRRATDRRFAFTFPSVLWSLILGMMVLVLVAPAARAQAPARGDVFYALLGRYLIRIDSSTGVGTLVNLQTPARSYRGLAIDPISRQIYAMSAGVLTILDAETNEAFDIGPTTNCTAITFDPVGRLYGVTGDGLELIEIDPVTGATTTIGGTPASLGSLAFDAATGFLYAGRREQGSVDDGILYRIDPLTGQSEVVGISGERSLTGLTFDPAGQLWGVRRQESELSGDLLVRIDKDTAALTVIGNTGFDGVTGLDIVTPLTPTTPEIASITDIGNDQGRQVRISVLASNLDTAFSDQPILRYVVFRRIDSLPMGRRIPGWDQVAVIEAFGEPLYNTVVPTLADSTITTGQYWSVFKVRAATAEPTVFFESAPDSGYSLDNLSPAAPVGLAFVGATSLEWNDALEQDFAFYTVYASDQAVLDGSAVALGTTTESTFDVSGSAATYFHVTTTDFAGNASPASSLTSQVTSAPSIAGPARLEQNEPNPFNPTTTIRFALPKAGPVELTVYDVTGRKVNTLVQDTLGAGDHGVIWSGLDDSGLPVASGVYLYRLRAGTYEEARRMTLLK